MAYGGRTRAFTLSALLALAAFAAVVIVLVAGRGDASGATEDPSGTVERFLVAAGSGNGDTACGYLSHAEQRRVEHAAGTHVPCSQAFLNARLELGGRNYLADLAAVALSASQNGHRATVDATTGLGAVHFGLVPTSLTDIAQQPYQPPATTWRIDGGATALVRPVP